MKRNSYWNGVWQGTIPKPQNRKEELEQKIQYLKDIKLLWGKGLSPEEEVELAEAEKELKEME